MADDEGEVVKEDGPAPRHRYRICEVMESNGKGGRPRRDEIVSWEDLSDEDVKRLRQINEPRLKARHVAELDGRTVARGANVSVAEGEDDDPPLAANVRLDNPLEMVEFARRLSWDLYERDAEASARLREEAHQLTQRALEQGKQALELIEQLKAQAQRPAPVPPGRPLSLEDISKLIQVGASAVGEIMRQRPEK